MKLRTTVPVRAKLRLFPRRLAPALSLFSLGQLPGCVDTGTLFPGSGSQVPPAAMPTLQPAATPGVAPDATDDGSASSPPVAASSDSPPVDDRIGVDVMSTSPAEPSPAEPSPAEPSPAEPPAAPGSEMPSAGNEPVPPPDEPSEPSPPGGEGDPTGQAALCPSVTEALLLDFQDVGNDPTQTLFGDFGDELSGGTYIYPQAPAAAGGGLPLGLRSDVTAGDWHITGTVAQQAGFGVFFACQLLDASRFAGLSFTVSGSSMGPASLTFLVMTAANEVSRSWRILNGESPGPSFGRCTPAEREFDGTCNAARLEIELSPEPREVLVRFSELGGGAPEAFVNPSEITQIAWALPAPVSDTSGSVEPYAVDLRIDEIRFIDAP